jgi:hypothetical protein
VTSGLFRETSKVARLKDSEGGATSGVVLNSRQHDYKELGRGGSKEQEIEWIDGRECGAQFHSIMFEYPALWSTATSASNPFSFSFDEGSLT